MDEWMDGQRTVGWAYLAPNSQHLWLASDGCDLGAELHSGMRLKPPSADFSRYHMLSWLLPFLPYFSHSFVSVPISGFSELGPLVSGSLAGRHPNGNPPPVQGENSTQLRAGKEEGASGCWVLWGSSYRSQRISRSFPLGACHYPVNGLPFKSR
jgi:hypothetical protein